MSEESKIVSVARNADVREGRHRQAEGIDVSGNIQRDRVGIFLVKRRQSVAAQEAGISRQTAVGHDNACEGGLLLRAGQIAAVARGDLQPALAGGIKNNRIVDCNASRPGVQGENRRIDRRHLLVFARHPRQVRPCQSDAVARPKIRRRVGRIVEQERGARRHGGIADIAGELPVGHTELAAVEGAVGIAHFTDVNIAARPDVPGALDQTEADRPAGSADAGVGIENLRRLSVLHRGSGQNRAGAVGHGEVSQDLVARRERDVARLAPVSARGARRLIGGCCWCADDVVSGGQGDVAASSGGDAAHGRTDAVARKRKDVTAIARARVDVPGQRGQINTAAAGRANGAAANLDAFAGGHGNGACGRLNGSALCSAAAAVEVNVPRARLHRAAGETHASLEIHRPIISVQNLRIIAENDVAPRLQEQPAGVFRGAGAQIPDCARRQRYVAGRLEGDLGEIHVGEGGVNVQREVAGAVIVSH